MTKSFFRTAIALLLAPILFASPAYPASRPQPAPARSPSAHRADPPAAQASQDKSYVIGDGDVLGINVWNEPDFKQSLPVRSDGRITLPLIGSVQAAGRTPTQLEKAIAVELEAYIHHPNVAVMVLKINSRNFNILGRVAKPGTYPLSGTTTVLDAIAQAGGFTAFAKESHIYVLRKDPKLGDIRIHFNYKQVIKGKYPEQNILLQPQDTVVVP